MKSVIHIIFLTTACCWLTDVEAQTFDAEASREDLRFLTEAMEANIPGLTTYHPEFRTNANALLQQIDQPLSLLQHFAMVSRLAALGNEGHIQVIDPDAAPYNRFSADRYRYLPVAVRLISDRLYLEDFYTGNDALKKGLEITAINAQSSAEIIGQLRQHIPSDGFITTYQDHKISEGFNWLYYLYIGQPEQFELRLRAPGSGEKMQISITAATLSEMRDFYQMRNRPSSLEGSGSKVFSLHFEHDIAHLKLTSFDWRYLKEEGLKSRQLYKRIFREINSKGVRDLIIDLRGNTGGRNEFAKDIIPFINKSRYRGTLKTSISWTGKVKKYKVPKPGKWLFKGRLIVLVDGKTYSAGSALARYLREYGDARIIGEETGTRYEGFVAGSSNLIVLPHSGLKLWLPRYHNQYPDSKIQQTANRGLIPDIEIKLTHDDWLKDVDRAYERALELLKE